MSDPAASVPANNPLADFPAEVQAAHRRWQETRDTAAADQVILAVLLDFVPAGKKGSIPAAPGDTTHLVNDLGYDSLAIAELVFFLEDIYGVRINLAELQGIATIGDLRQQVRRLLAG